MASSGTATANTPPCGRVAVVTGRAKGNGWATVASLVADGATPVLFDRDAEAHAAAGRRLDERGIDHLAIALDVADAAAAAAAMAQVLARFARIDVLGGSDIVNVASIMGLSGGGLYPNQSYQATKGAVVNLTRALAVEWAGRDIRVNAVAPTWAKTDLAQGLFDQPELIARVLDMTPLRRLAEPADVADAIVFLASRRAAMITGHTLPVDGGFLAQ